MGRFIGRLATRLSPLVVCGLLAAAPRAQDIGFEGPQFSPSSATPTESKPQNKLWHNDGFWWGALWSTGAGAFRIHRLNFATNAWTDTGPAIESRSGSHSDVLWDGTKLYIASHQFTSGSSSSGNPMLLFRYSYNTGSDSYSLDSGFPATIGDVSTESLTIEKDSTGTVWAAWTQSNRVRITHTLASDTSWSAPIILPTNTTNLDSDDLCGIVAFNGDRIGVLWSDQSVNAYRFSVHMDGAADTTWSAVENATSGETDDHLNLAAHSDGRVFFAGKNAANNLLLLVRALNGSWSRFIVSPPSPVLTRPIVLLNEPANTIHVFCTGQDTGEVFEKTSSISSISFPSGTGTIRMRDSGTLFRISNPSSTKQNFTASSGLVVLAHHDTTGFYWHHEVDPTGGPGAPTANFTADPTSGNAPLDVDFTDTSSGSITSRSWNFGDGDTSTATNPSHTYDTAGTYTVSLTVTGTGGSDTETKTGFIVVSGGTAPVANFSANPTSGTAPLNVAFTNTSTGNITSRSWNFGDGGTSTSTNPSHTYQTAGTYTVSLTVNGPGGSDTETKTDFIVVSGGTAPVANFTANQTSGNAPLNVVFTNTSTGNITSRSWNFGDGGTSTAINPSHTYQTAGTYTVSLTVNGPGGSDTETKTDFIVVSGGTAPVANFTANQTSGNAPLNVAFTNTSTGNITSRSWNFGDGGTSTANNPSHTYQTAGTYTVSLTVNGPGGSDTETKTGFIVVSGAGAPVANFIVNKTSGNAPLTVLFRNTSTGNVTSRSWDFGDGGTSTINNPSHVYQSAGTYTVALTVTGPGGSDTETKVGLITVNGGGGGDLVLTNPTPGTVGVSNTIRVTGATPNGTVVFYRSLALGSSSVSRPGCPPIPLGLANPVTLMGTRQANAQGVAVLTFTPPASFAGRTLHFQVINQGQCEASNVVSEQF